MSIFPFFSILTLCLNFLLNPVKIFKIPHFSLKEKKKEKKCKDLNVGQNLIESAKISIP
jgi:hypothetical protein